MMLSGKTTTKMKNEIEKYDAMGICVIRSNIEITNLDI